MSCQTPRHAVTRRALLKPVLAGSTLWTLPGCRSTPLPTYQEAPGDGVTIYVIAPGWHTEIALPMPATNDPLKAVTPDFQAPNTSRSAGVSAELLHGARAHFRRCHECAVPRTSGASGDPAVPPAAGTQGPTGRCSRLACQRRGSIGCRTTYGRRSKRRAMGRRAASRQALSPGAPSTQATGTYSATYTCNTWTAESLRVGGLPVTPAGVVLASQVIDQLGR